MNEKREKLFKTIITIISAVIVVAALSMVFLTKAETQLSNTHLQLNCGVFSKTSVAYADITSIEYRDSFDVGSRTFGIATGSISGGTFTNNEFGAYFLNKHNSVSSVIIIKHNAKITVFNDNSVENTKALYDDVKAKANL